MKSNICLVLILVTTIISISSNTVLGISLDEDGGYNIVVAIEPSTAEPSNTTEYIENLKNSFQRLSDNLFLATVQKFHIKSIEILIPDNWDSAAELVEVEITKSYETAEFRLSENVKHPKVDNPNPCGISGNYISLPFSFFETQVGPYGPTWKALLPLWARFRWGVWEEHGYPTDMKYPYFSKTTVDAENWIATGCSNTDLIGTYENEDGEQCDVNSPSQSPPSNCRFLPDLNNNQATSSLMYFHWLENVNQFCDNSTHNKFAPNRQNLLCNQKSILEIMEESSDYQAVISPSNPADEIEFKLVKPNSAPFLYFLIDKGYPEVDAPLLNTVVHGLIKFFQPKALPNVMTGLGIFPSNNLIYGSYLNTQLGFMPLENNEDAFVEKLGLFSADGEINRDFASPIIKVVEMIKSRKLIGGGIIFMLKIGGNEIPERMPFEDETAALLRDEQIKIIALELGNTHLGNFLEKSGGHLYSVTSVDQVDDTINGILGLLNTELNKPVEIPAENVDLVFKGALQPSSTVEFQVTEHLTTLEFYLILPSSNTGAITMRVNGASVSYLRSSDWSISGPSSRQILMSSIENKENATWTFSFTCSGSCGTKASHLLLYGIGPTSSLSSLSLGTLNDNDGTEVEIEISTSSPNNVVDFQKTYATLSPFGVYAKVTKGGIPVRDLDVTAFILNDHTEDVSEFKLFDNGLGTPDVDELDGVYSSNFIPDKDGDYKIFVSVENLRVKTIDTIRENYFKMASHTSQRLLPIDQFAGIDKEESIVLDGLFHRTVQLTETIRVINREALTDEIQSRPFKITDVTVQTNENRTGIIISFTVPNTWNETNPSLLYSVYASNNLESIISEEPILSAEPGTPESGNPSRRYIDILTEEIQRFRYVGVASLNGPTQSVLSNIIKLTENPHEETTSTALSSTTDSFSSTTPSDETPTTTPFEQTPNTTPPEEITIPSSGGSTMTTSEETPSTSSPSTERSTTVDSTTEDDENPFFKTGWGIVVIIVIALLIGGGIGIGIQFYLKKRSMTQDFEKLMKNETPVGNSSSNPV